MKWSGGRWGGEAALALVLGTGWFALWAVLLGRALPHSPVVVVAVVAIDVAVVLTVAHFMGIGYAVTIGVASVVALDWFYIPPIHPATLPDPQNSVALAAYLLTGVLLGELAVTARRRAEASEGARSLLVNEQAALRRVAGLVAREPSPGEVFAAVSEEVGKLLAIDMTALLRYETDGTATVVGAWSATGRQTPIGARLPLEGDSVAAEVLQTSRPARIDSYAKSAGALATYLRDLGVRSSVGSPIVVEGHLWGVMVGASVSDEPIAAGTESRLDEFTELAATAVANAQSRDELTASRARIVATSDQARRHIERNLHDGVQQRLVSLALDLRVAEELAHAGSEDLRSQLARVREGLAGALEDLREISHGIHPAILSEGGLRPALATVARRSPVPVELNVHVPDRLPEPVEVGVYFIASEALANVIKHAHATQVHLDLDSDQATTTLLVRDDGVGGADPNHGSGLIGLADRVHALGGAIRITSPTGSGTSIEATIPLGT